MSNLPRFNDKELIEFCKMYVDFVLTQRYPGKGRRAKIRQYEAAKKFKEIQYEYSIYLVDMRELDMIVSNLSIAIVS